MEADNLKLAYLSRVSGPSWSVIASFITGARIECSTTVAHAANEAPSLHYIYLNLLSERKSLFGEQRIKECGNATHNIH